MARPLTCQVIFTICHPKLHAYGACNVALPHCRHHSGVQWWWGAMVVMQRWWSRWRLSLRRKSFVCLLITCLWWGKHHGTYLPVTVRVYPYPHSRVGVYVGSDIPYPDPYPPNPYLCTHRGFQTLADHYPQQLERPQENWFNVACMLTLWWLRQQQVQHHAVQQHMCHWTYLSNSNHFLHSLTICSIV